MKLVSWLSLIALAAALVGCGEGATNAPEDDAFQKQIAEAAAKNKGAAPTGRRGGGMGPPPGSAKGAPPKTPGTDTAGATGATTAGATAPGATTPGATTTGG